MSTGAAGCCVVEHFFGRWYRRNWRATAVSSVLQPVLFLVAFGVGFGTLVAGRPGVGAATGGVPYLVWLTPALLAVVGRAERRVRVVLPGALGLQVAAHLPRDDGRRRSRPAQVAIGHIAWVAIKLTLTGAVFVVVAALRRRGDRAGDPRRPGGRRAHRHGGHRARHGVRGHRRARPGLQRALPADRHADHAVLRHVLPGRAAARRRAAAGVDLAALARHRAGPGRRAGPVGAAARARPPRLPRRAAGARASGLSARFFTRRLAL